MTPMTQLRLKLLTAAQAIKMQAGQNIQRQLAVGGRVPVL